MRGLAAKAWLRSAQLGPGGERPLVFVHIPRTGGMSFRLEVANRYPPERFYPDYGPDEDGTSARVMELLYSRSRYPGARARARLLRELLRCGDCFLAGHFRYSDFRFHPGRFRLVTFVRDPLERVLSHHEHSVKRLGYEGSLRDFVRTPEARNVQARYLAGVDLRRFELVGLTERYAESLARFAAGNDREMEVHDTNRLNESGRARSDLVDEGTARLIRELNQDDYALHRRAVEIFAGQAPGA